MGTARVHINRDILIWAVERIGKTVDEYVAENPVFQQWLDGTILPTYKNIEQFAHKLYVPLGYMFLPEPPKEIFPIPFFRNKDNRSHNINLYDTVIDMQERQEWLSGYLHRMGFDKIDYVGIFTPQNTVREVVDKIKEILGLQSNWALEFNNVDSALKYLTKKIEEKGVIVTFNSVVGFNNKRPIPVEDCRGFVLVDDYAPFIFVNSKDAKVAQIFTIIHEFAHILTGYSAGVGNIDMEQSSDIERYCDKIAASFLVPEELFRNLWKDYPGNYEVLSKYLKVSRLVIARRAVELNFISQERFFQLYNHWSKEPKVKVNSSGGNFYPSAIKKNSRTFLIHVNTAINRNMLLHMDAYRLTGLKGDTFHKIINSSSFV